MQDPPRRARAWRPRLRTCGAARRILRAAAGGRAQDDEVSVPQTGRRPAAREAQAGALRLPQGAAAGRGRLAGGGDRAGATSGRGRGRTLGPAAPLCSARAARQPRSISALRSPAPVSAPWTPPASPCGPLRLRVSPGGSQLSLRLPLSVSLSLSRGPLGAPAQPLGPVCFAFAPRPVGRGAEWRQMLGGGAGKSLPGSSPPFPHRPGLRLALCPAPPGAPAGDAWPCQLHLESRGLSFPCYGMGSLSSLLWALSQGQPTHPLSWSQGGGGGGGLLLPFFPG